MVALYLLSFVSDIIALDLMAGCNSEHQTMPMLSLKKLILHALPGQKQPGHNLIK